MSIFFKKKENVDVSESTKLLIQEDAEQIKFFFEEEDEDFEDEKEHETELEDEDDEESLEEEYFNNFDADIINEARSVKNSRKVVVKTKKQKLASLAQKASMAMAKEVSDPLYKQYKAARKLEVTLRKRIEKKYGNKAKAIVKESLKEKPKNTRN